MQLLLKVAPLEVLLADSLLLAGESWAGVRVGEQVVARGVLHDFNRVKQAVCEVREEVWVQVNGVEQLELVLGTRLGSHHLLVAEHQFLLVRVQIALRGVKFVAEAWLAVEGSGGFFDGLG